jgi:uncharacterized damage-inducible protein DinB
MTGTGTEAQGSRYLGALPTETIELHPIIALARARIVAAAAELRSVQDGALEQAWRWRGEPSEVRYGFYDAYEQLEVASGAVRGAVTQAGTVPAAGAGRAARATAARWDLHARLLPLTEDDLDRDPGGGEWTIRQTLAHIINAQRAYGHYTAWWFLQRDVDPFPDTIPASVDDGFPDEAIEGDGSLAEVRARLDDLLDLETAHMAGLDEAQLAARAKWSGVWVDVGFRMGRWSSHLREHTVQVDKTLVMLAWTPREVDRLVGLIVGAYGRLEAEVFGLPAAVLDHMGSDGRTPAGVIDEVAARLAALAPSVLASSREDSPRPA